MIFLLLCHATSLAILLHGEVCSSLSPASRDDFDLTQVLVLFNSHLSTPIISDHFQLIEHGIRYCHWSHRYIF